MADPMQFDGFDWDGSNRDKCERHGVAVAEIEGLFGAALRVGRDVAHSTVEQRFRAIGLTRAGRSLFVVFTWRVIDGKRLIRPISARYMHRKEVRAYEQAIS